MSIHDSVLNDNHVLFNTQNDIADICKPLSIYLGIGYFHFRRTFRDGSYIVLATDFRWPLHFIQKNIPIKTPITQQCFDSKSYFCQWRGNIPDQTVSDAKNYYGIKNAVALVEKNEDYFDSYSFASDKDCEEVNDTYINNVDAFSKFVPYFQEKASILIAAANKQLIVPPDVLKDPSISVIMDLEENYNKRNFIEAITLNKNSLKLKTGRVILTKREMECLQHLACGKNRKEIGKLVGLSSRTVDTHLEKARDKLGCFTTSELIDIWWANHR